MVDSGATEHMAGDRRLLKNLNNNQKTKVTFGNSKSIISPAFGTLKLGSVALEKVLYVPGLHHDLISVRQLPSSARKWKFTPSCASLVSNNGSILISAPFNPSSKLYTFSEFFQAHLGATDNLNLFQHWHHRLGHFNIASIGLRSQKGRLGNFKLSSVMKNAFESSACKQGKGTRLAAPPSDVRASGTLDLLHIDIWGPARIPTVSGARYFLTCLNDYSRKINIYLLKHKSEAFSKLQYHYTVHIRHSPVSPNNKF